MIYLDAAYVAKCYLNEPGAERVRALAYEAAGLASCELARLEFMCAVRRHVREDNLTPRHARGIFEDFARDERDGVWHWFPLGSELMATVFELVRRLPAARVLRAGDALHLGCARANGFAEVFTNDRHMLAAASHFGVSGVNVLE